MQKSIRVAWCLYFIALVVFAVFAYGLTVPNLILSNSNFFVTFQWFMWHTFYNQRQVLTESFLILVAILFTLYFFIINQSRKQPTLLSMGIWKKYLPWLLVLLIPLWAGYNALSADIFNYIFNARMIVLYHMSPYQHVAFDFPDDTWTRFMHNITTFSPYGYGWTAFSVVLYVLGLSKFLITWLIFKGAATLSLLLLSGVYAFKFDSDERSSVSLTSFLLVMINPLVLLEYGLTGHNDIWMMLLAILSFRLIAKHGSGLKITTLVASLALLLLSITFKFATELLLPIWLLVVMATLIPRFKFKDFVLTWWPILAALAMFLPLMTARSQYFNPWYLSWSLVWVPFFPKQVANRWLRQLPSLLTTILICFSVTSLVRYVPWLLSGNYGDVVLHQEYMITWLAVPIGLVGHASYLIIKALRKKQPALVKAAL